MFTSQEGKHKFHSCRIEGILVLLIDRKEGKVINIKYNSHFI